MLFIFALPVMQVILFCLAIGRDPVGLKLAIVNHEATYYNMTYQPCPFEYNCTMANFSCRYLNHLKNDTIIKQYYADPKDALDAVKSGDAWGALYFTENFTDALVARIALGRGSDDETLDQSEIRVWLDMSSKNYSGAVSRVFLIYSIADQQIGIILQRDIQLSYQDFAKSMLESCSQNPAIADVPINFKKPIYGSSQPSFTDFVAPGVILTYVIRSYIHSG